MAASMSEPKPQGATLGALLSLAWPVILARATQSVIGFCDALMVAPLGEEPLAAATTGALNTFAFIILPMGAAFIVQSFVAQLRGRGDLAATPRYAFYGLGLAVLAGVMVLPFFPFLDDVLLSLGYSPRVTELMSSYMIIRLLSVPGAVGIEALGNWFGGLGKTRPAMIAGIVAMVANVFGNWLLIMPRFGMPGLGVAGAAWASAASSYLGFAFLLALFMREREGGKLASAALRELRWSEFVRVLRFGLPNGVNWFLEFSAFAVFINLVVGHLGTTVLAAFNVVIQINSISFMPAFGLASAGAIMVGEAIGRKALDEVWPLVRLTAGVAAAWMGSIALIYVGFAALLMSLFQPEGVRSTELVTVGTTMLALSAIWQLFDAVGLTFSEALRAAGDTAWCMGARLVLAWVVFTPAAWLAVLVLDGGVLTVMGALIAYIVALAVTFALRFASGRWRNIDLVGSEPELVPPLV
jgi:MATE family multidrug resistance protein